MYEGSKQGSEALLVFVESGKSHKVANMHESRHSSKANQSSTPLSDGDEPSHGVKGTFAVQRHTATSEPSHSARPSMEGDDQPKLSTRKSVAFDDSGTPERPPGADPHQSPFACVAGTDAGAALDAVLPSGSFAIPPQHLRNGRSAGMDQAATSAPPQSLDAVATTAIAQERGVNNGSAAQRLMAGNASRNFRQAGGPTTHAVVNYGGSRRRTAPASGGRPSLEVFAPSALPNESASTRIRGTSVSASEGLLSCDIAELFGEAFAAEVGTSAQPPAGISHSESRSSMDVLLSAPTPTPHARQSLDSLQELLRPVNRTHSNEQGAGTAAEALLRSSLLSGRGAFGSMAQLKLSRSPTASPRSPGLSSLTSSVTVVAQPKLRAAAMTAQPSVGALASNIVDQYNAPVPTAGRAAVARSPPGQMTTLKEEYEAAVAAGAAPAAAQLDADLHDTFGAHAWYCGPNTGAAGSSHRVSPRGVKGGNALDGQISGVVLGSGRGPGSAAVLRHTASARLASQRHMSARGTAKLLEPTTVHGQHSVTLHDSQCTVPSYDFLRQRQRARSDEASGTLSSGGGYIAEAKRVLSEAMRSGSRSDAEVRDSSYSGAIGPLLKHLESVQGDDGKSRAALHTLSLLESNLPNRAIISELQGTQVLAGTLRSCRALDVREAAVQLLWDINSVVDKSAASVLIVDDLFALMAVLQETREAAVASHALHLLHHAFVKVPAGLTPAQRSEMGKKIVEETCAHKHHLQDAAQYTLGELLGTVLACSSISTADVNAAVEALMTALAGCSEPGQCQVLLTVVSCLAGRQRLRAALAREPMRQMLVQFAQKVDDGRLQARSLSLIKVLNKEDHVGPCAAAEGVSWYFGAEALV